MAEQERENLVKTIGESLHSIEMRLLLLCVFSFVILVVATSLALPSSIADRLESLPKLPLLPSFPSLSFPSSLPPLPALDEQRWQALVKPEQLINLQVDLTSILDKYTSTSSFESVIKAIENGGASIGSVTMSEASLLQKYVENQPYVLGPILQVGLVLMATLFVTSSST